jgi:DNA-binding transcriptional MerR regulator
MRSGSVLKPLLKIGELSKQTQIAVGLLRYYYYAAESVEQVCFIQKAQALGFSLPEIQHILGVRVLGPSRNLVVKQLLDQKIAGLNDEIQRLTAFKADLENYQSQSTQQELPKDDYLQGLCQLIDRVRLPAIGPIKQSA